MRNSQATLPRAGAQAQPIRERSAQRYSKRYVAAERRRQRERKQLAAIEARKRREYARGILTHERAEGYLNSFSRGSIKYISCDLLRANECTLIGHLVCSKHLAVAAHADGILITRAPANEVSP